MVELAPADYEGVLDLVVEAARNVASGEMLPVSTLDHVHRLIPTADTVAYWPGSPSRHRHAITVAGDHDPWTPGEDRLLDRLDFQDPLLPATASIGRARRLSDAMDPQVYRATEFYRRLGRRHRLEFSIATWLGLPDGTIRGLWLDASRQDFDDRDVVVLELISRQLTRLMTPIGGSSVGGPRRKVVGLTDRQAEIVALVALGRSNDEIAHDLSISPDTVRTHLEHAFDRLDVHTRAAAVGRAWELGILPRTPRRPA